MVLATERIYVVARAFTSASKNVSIDVAFSNKKAIKDDITVHLSSAGTQSIIDPQSN